MTTSCVGGAWFFSMICAGMMQALDLTRHDYYNKPRDLSKNTKSLQALMDLIVRRGICAHAK